METLDVLDALNSIEGNAIVSPYSFDKAVSAAEYMMSVTEEKPDTAEIEGLEEFNSWYSEQDDKFKEAEDRSKELFGKKRKKVDFSEPKETADIVNSDCSETTHGMINGIIEASDVYECSKNPNFIGIVLNTIYLKKSWLNKKERVFDYLFNGETETTAMSSEEMASVFWYRSEPVVTIDFEEGFRFHAFMPKDISGGLSENDYNFLSGCFRKNLKYQTTIITMPEIFAESQFDTIKAYENGAMLEVMQKAKIECDYKGVVAAAATAVLCISGQCFNIETPQKIDLNKPFFYFIEKDGKVLFIGKVVNP